MIHRILTKVFNTPWLVKPSTLHAIEKAVVAKIAGQIQDPQPAETADAQEPVSSVPQIAVIPVFGILGKHLSMFESMCGGYDVNDLVTALKQARDDASVSSIVLYFNSPGGTVTGVPEAAALIAQIDTVKPVYAFTDSLCASGAYYLASQCRSIIATETADLGSVGVYQIFVDESQALRDAGIAVNAISAGTYKLAGASFRPMSDEEKAMFQQDVNRIYTKFKAAVTSKRTIDDQYLQGQCFDGEQAVTYGLADGLVNDLDEFLALITPAAPEATATNPDK